MKRRRERERKRGKETETEIMIKRMITLQPDLRKIAKC